MDVFGVRANSVRSEAYTALARCLSGGLPLPDALRLAGREGQGFGDVLRRTASSVELGHTFGEAFHAASNGLGPGRDEQELLKAGEASGSLPEMLERLAGRLRLRAARRRRVFFGLLYPFVLLNATILAVGAPQVVQGIGAFLAWVVPKLLVLWFAIGFGAWALQRVMRRESRRRQVVDLAARLPFVGQAIRCRAAAEYSEVCSLCLGAGLPLVRSLELAGRASDWSDLVHASHRISLAVQRGIGLGQAHAAEASVAEELVEAFKIGEASGSLEVSLKAAAGLLGARAARLENALAVAIPVAIYLAVAGVVAVVVVSFYQGLMSSVDGL